MSLSKREQRVLEQLERSLYAEDPASGADLEARVRASDIRIVAVALFPKPLIGAVVLGLLGGVVAVRAVLARSRAGGTP